MASVCISSCINDARVPVRPTYRNLYKWPESDADFIRSVSSNPNRTSRVVDSISCRQMYLRSYTFSREEDNLPDNTNNFCFRKLRIRRKKNVSRRRNSIPTPPTAVPDGFNVRKCSHLKKAKELSCAAFASVFRRLLLCTAKVDVADNLRD